MDRSTGDAGMNTTIVVVDDHADVRETARIILSADPRFTILRECGDGLEAIEAAGTLQPNVVLMDIMLPHLDGLRATAEIHRLFPAIQVVVLSIHEHAGYVTWALSAGATGYVLKRSMGRDLITALEAAARHERFLSPTLSVRLPPASRIETLDAVDAGRLPVLSYGILVR
jgi:DNA-binding NarL/FixJ family response regulator